MNQSLLFNDDFQVIDADSCVRFSGMAGGRNINVIIKFVRHPIPTTNQLTPSLKLDLEALVEDWCEDNDLDEVCEIQLVY